jgi:hypothetical protein
VERRDIILPLTGRSDPPPTQQSPLSYEVTITVGNDTWSYAEITMLRMNEFDEPFAHNDHNTLRRVG